jgi:hypothetical protein
MSCGETDSKKPPLAQQPAKTVAPKPEPPDPAPPESDAETRKLQALKEPASSPLAKAEPVSDTSSAIILSDPNRASKNEQLEFQALKDNANFNLLDLTVDAFDDQHRLTGISLRPSRNYNPSRWHPVDVEFRPGRKLLIAKRLPLAQGALGTGWVTVDVSRGNGESLRFCYQGDGDSTTETGHAAILQTVQRYRSPKTPLPCYRDEKTEPVRSSLVIDVTHVSVNFAGGGVSPERRGFSEIKLELAVLPDQT